MNILHKPEKGVCNGEVSVDVSNIFGIFSEIAFTDEGLILRNSSVEQKRHTIDSVEEVNFVCKTCSEPVKVSEMVVVCNHCYEYFPVEELFISKEYGGTYCSKGIKDVFENNKENFIPLIEIINSQKIYLIK